MLLKPFNLDISKMLKEHILTYLAKITDFSICFAFKSVIESTVI